MFKKRKLSSAWFPISKKRSLSSKQTNTTSSKPVCKPSQQIESHQDSSVNTLLENNFIVKNANDHPVQQKKSPKLVPSKKRRACNPTQTLKRPKNEEDVTQHKR